MHYPPGRRSVSGTWGSLEATVSMAHAAPREARAEPAWGERPKINEKAKP